MKKIIAGNFYCGTSNIVLPVPNKAHFPAAYRNKSRLNYYASLFNAVEINSSFYKIPMPGTVEKWTLEVPVNFRFTFKLWRGITHARELQYEKDDVKKFMNAVRMAGRNMGCLLIQFPRSINLSYLLSVSKLLDDVVSTGGNANWKISVEFRDRSWYQDKLYALLDRYDANVVLHDMPASAPPVIDMQTNCNYLRFHGEKGDYKGSYADDCLMEHAIRIREWVKNGKQVFAYFNNTMGAAVHNAQTLSSFYNAANELT